jgi:hypothetical protein
MSVKGGTPATPGTTAAAAAAATVASAEPVVLGAELLVDGVQQQQQQQQQDAAVDASGVEAQQAHVCHDNGVAAEPMCASASTSAAVSEQSHKQQQAVHTAGMPFTLVTSVLAAHSIAAAAAGSSKRQLQAQLQQLEDQAAQLASVDLVETPRLAQVAAAADGAVPGGSGGLHAKKLTAGQARAPAKHLQQASPAAAIKDAAATTSSSTSSISSAAAGVSKNPHAHVASPAVGYGGKKSSKQPLAAAEAAVATTQPSSCVPVCPSQPVGKAASAAVASVERAAHAVVGGDAANIVNAATRAGPAHMQDIWA